MRRWVSTVDGLVEISGTLRNTSGSGDGTVGRILRNGEEVFAEVTDGSIVDYSVDVQVSVGDVLDFAIDPDGAGNLATGGLDAISDGSDSTDFTASISTKEVFSEPCGVQQLVGDCNQDGATNIADVLCAVSVLFPGFDLLNRAPAPEPCATAEGTAAILDLSGDGSVDAGDIALLAESLFGTGGPALECALVPDDIGCEQNDGCQ
jgi:hypothetical protein